MNYLLGMMLSMALACQPSFSSGVEQEDDTAKGLGDDTASTQPTSSVYINEFMASNSSIVFEGMTEDYTPDWIELYNASADPLDLEGFSITDDLNEPDAHTFTKLVIEPYGYVVLYADGRPDDGPQHVDFKLDMDGESIGLYAEDGSPLDRINYTGMTSDFVAARIPDGGELVGIYESTPGAANPTEVSD